MNYCVRYCIKRQYIQRGLTDWRSCHNYLWQGLQIREQVEEMRRYTDSTFHYFLLPHWSLLGVSCSGRYVTALHDLGHTDRLTRLSQT